MLCDTITSAMTPDVVTNAIVAAISAGAVSGAKETAKAAIADGYQGLKSLIKTTFGHHSEAVKAIDGLESKPASDGRKQTLAEELDGAGVTTHQDLVSAAEALLALIKALPQGEKHVQFAQGTGIAQADRGSTATVTMSAPSRKDD
jgi:hypothetical protein